MSQNATFYRCISLPMMDIRYVSVVIQCPYSGRVDPAKVKDVSRALLEMGCYEISLGDTVGMGTPATVRTMLETVMGGDRGLPESRLAVSRVYLGETF